MGGAGNDTLWGGADLAVAGIDTLDGGDGDDLFHASFIWGEGSDGLVLTGGLGSDTYHLFGDGLNILFGAGTVAAPVRITDFNVAEGDLLLSGIPSGSWQAMPVVWRGQANPDFLAAEGQGMAMAGADAAAERLLEFWTSYDASADQTTLFADGNLNFVVDAGDLKIVFVGHQALSPAIFSSGTVLARVGTAAADTSATLAPTGLADTLLGSGGDDSLHGDLGDDYLHGEQGADVLQGDGGHDKLFGGPGNDTARGGDENDTLFGGVGSDSLEGGAGSDVLHAGMYRPFMGDSLPDDPASVNVLDGGAGNDFLFGDAGTDHLHGGEGEDTLDGHEGSNSLHGGAGNDTYYVRTANDVVIEAAGEGNDRIFTFLTRYALGDELESATLLAPVSARLTGNSLHNALTGGTGDDTLSGLDGNDTLDGGGGGADRLVGGAGDDQYKVSGAGDVVVEGAGGGTDTVLSYSDTLTLVTGVENGSIMVATGASLTGNTLHNGLTGGVGGDTLAGGSGNDTLDGGGGWDALAGGQGNDTYYVDTPYDALQELPGEGIDLVISTATYSLSPGLENLVLAGTAAISGTGNGLGNVIRGNSADNVLVGGGGSDSLSGAAGDDRLSGGIGNDTLVGGAGKDWLTGETGNDSFVFRAGSDSTGTAPDVILDFAHGDKIDLSLLDANVTTAAAVENFAFIGTAPFSATDATAQLRYSYDSASSTLMLYGSTDGDSKAEIVVEIHGVSSLASTDFLF